MRNKINYLILALIALTFLFFLSLFFNLFNIFPNKTVQKYYDVLRKDLNAESVIVTEIDYRELLECEKFNNNQKKENCFQDWYEEYTFNNDMEKAFSHLGKFIDKNPQLTGPCHYMSHGIGHGQLRKNEGNVSLAFSAMTLETYFKNIATCGNGYFHGVIEKFVKGEKDKQKLVEMIKGVCDEKEEYGKAGDCFHGAGHALFLQLDYDLVGTLDTCEKITDIPLRRYNCYTGTFMEAGQTLPTASIVEVKDGKMKYLICETLPMKYKLPCYHEQTGYFEVYSKSDDYAQIINYCKQIENEYGRLACVKTIALRAVRIGRDNKIEEICIKNTSNKTERIECVTTFAFRIARSIKYQVKSEEYKKIAREICNALSFYERGICKEKILDPNTTYMNTYDKEILENTFFDKIYYGLF